MFKGQVKDLSVMLYVIKDVFCHGNCYLHCFNYMFHTY